MSKINMNDKFFHAINFDDKNDLKKILVLSNILEEGRLLSLKDRGIANNNQIYFSVYPEGMYKDIYNGTDKTIDTYTGFDMTNSSFYFILNSNLRKDYDLYPGAYPLECVARKPVLLKKYLVGIGNAGYKIDVQLQFCYYYTLLLNNKITEEDFYNKVKEIYFPQNNIKDIIKSHTMFNNNWRGDTDYNRFILKSISKKPEELLFPGIYDQVKNVFKEHDISIKFYDSVGYSVEPEKQLKKIIIMQDYIKRKAKYIENPYNK